MRRLPQRSTRTDTLFPYTTLFRSKDRAITVARERGIVRARDFDAAGIPRAYLRRLQDEGLLVRMGRGLYQLADAEWSESHSLAEAARAVPHGVICLLSALRFHELTTQLPHQVWMLTGHKKWAPKNPPVSLQNGRASFRERACQCV